MGWNRFAVGRDGVACLKLQYTGVRREIVAGPQGLQITRFCTLYLRCSGGVVGVKTGDGTDIYTLLAKRSKDIMQGS